MIPRQVKTDIIKYCQRMDQKGWVANHDGNITVALSTGSLAATPTARSKVDLVEEDLIEIDKSGKKISGKGSTFSEISMHLKVFSVRKDVSAVVHAHPPYVMAAGSANQEMLTWAIPEAVVSLGPGIPLVGLGLPNSPEVLGEFERLLQHYDAVMVAGNGVFTWGKTLEQAFLRLELVEHIAKIMMIGAQLGQPQILSASQIAGLLKKRADAGLGLPPDPNRSHWFPT